jgi:hypothetical protein
MEALMIRTLAWSLALLAIGCGRPAEPEVDDTTADKADGRTLHEGTWHMVHPGAGTIGYLRLTGLKGGNGAYASHLQDTLNGKSFEESFGTVSLTRKGPDRFVTFTFVPPPGLSSGILPDKYQYVINGNELTLTGQFGAFTMTSFTPTAEERFREDLRFLFTSTPVNLPDVDRASLSAPLQAVFDAAGKHGDPVRAQRLTVDSGTGFAILDDTDPGVAVTFGLYDDAGTLLAHGSAGTDDEAGNDVIISNWTK